MTETKNTVPISFRTTEETAELLRDYAGLVGKDLSEVIRLLLEESMPRLREIVNDLNELRELFSRRDFVGVEKKIKEIEEKTGVELDPF